MTPIIERRVIRNNSSIYEKNEPRQLTQSAVLVIYKLAEAVRHFRAISSEGERHLDTVEVTGSIPVSPTVILVTGSAGFSPAAHAVHADVAQLVEHHLAKVRVAGSSPVIRSMKPVVLSSVLPLLLVGWPSG